MEYTIKNACEEGLVKQLLWRSEPTVGGDTVFDKFSHFNDTKVFHQTDNEKTSMACSIFGESHTLHDYENEATQDPFRLWDRAIEFGASVQTGWSMGGALRMFIKLGFIKGFALVEGIEAIKTKLLLKPIYCGSNKISWVETKKDPKKIAKIVKSGPGHCFEICGFDNNYIAPGVGALECKNSIEGFERFRVAYTDIEALYSTIEIFLNEENVSILKQKADLECLELAKKKGVTNGNELGDPCTRGAMAAMIMRIKHGNLPYSDAIKLARAEGIFDGSRESDWVYRDESWIMLGRFISAYPDKKMSDNDYIELCIKSGITSGGDNRKYATRLQAAVMCGRVLKLQS